MGNTLLVALLVANEKEAYVLTDIGTFLKYKKESKIPYLALYEGGNELLNVYSAYLANSCEGEEAENAKAFIDFLVNQAQDLIANYGVSKYGKHLF